MTASLLRWAGSKLVARRDVVTAFVLGFVFTFILYSAGYGPVYQINKRQETLHEKSAMKREIPGITATKSLRSGGIDTHRKRNDTGSLGGKRQLMNLENVVKATRPMVVQRPHKKSLMRKKAESRTKYLNGIIYGDSKHDKSIHENRFRSVLNEWNKFVEFKKVSARDEFLKKSFQDEVGRHDILKGKIMPAPGRLEQTLTYIPGMRKKYFVPQYPRTIKLPQINGQLTDQNSARPPKVIMYSQKICGAHTLGKQPIVLAFFSAISHVTRRRFLRSSFHEKLLSSSLPGRTFQRIFFFGQQYVDTKLAIPISLLDEEKIYRDVVIGDFVDTYRNLTLKSLTMLTFINKHCSHAKYVIKIDDDVILNLATLIKELERAENSGLRHVWGYVHFNGKPVRCGGTSRHKWCDDQYERQVYPYYMDGCTYAISGDLIPQMCAIIPSTSFSPMEDVFVTGLLVEKLGNVHLRHIPFNDFVYKAQLEEF